MRLRQPTLAAGDKRWTPLGHTTILCSCRRTGLIIRRCSELPTQSLFSAVFPKEEKGGPRPAADFNWQSEKYNRLRCYGPGLRRGARRDGIIPVIYIVNNFGYSRTISLRR